jgi:hypothetical protein
MVPVQRRLVVVDLSSIASARRKGSPAAASELPRESRVGPKPVRLPHLRSEHWGVRRAGHEVAWYLSRRILAGQCVPILAKPIECALRLDGVLPRS